MTPPSIDNGEPIDLFSKSGSMRQRASLELSRTAAWFLACSTLLLVSYVLLQGYQGLNPSFILSRATAGTGDGMFDVHTAGVFDMVVGTVLLVFLMTLIVMPLGVITGIYLNEFAPQHTWTTRVLRSAVNNLAGVPSIIFGLFGVGFFIYFIGGSIDKFVLFTTTPVWGQPALLWAALTLAILTLPVVVISTEQALRAVPAGTRDAALAMGATKVQMLTWIVLPQAGPGILTGGILAVSRGAGEVAPIMFTGAAYYLAHLPNSLNSQFMELGYHIYVLSTQSPNIDKTRPLLFSTVVTLLLLTFLLNVLAIVARSWARRKQRTD